MFSKLKDFWTSKGYEIVIGVSVACIIIFGLYRWISGKEGTWSKQKYIPFYPTPRRYKRRRRGPPRESKGEIECRRVLQEIFGRPFHKDRPDFLQNPVTGGNFNLELDCYDPELRIAVEYNGRQHYEYTPYMHKNKESFLNQKYRDDMKRRICKEQGVLLIEVPYTVELSQIKNFIRKKLQENGINK